ncbi:MAG: formylglycine-generating enzyme family protein [Candidatus Lernaella stagnicola]|nr:formylglycine-generating enzyme family protein [Candidatus Lernaella stagnicola]
MKSNWLLSLAILFAVLFVVAFACSTDDSEEEADDDTDVDDDDDTDVDDDDNDDDDTAPTDEYEQDGVLIRGKPTDENGFVSFTVDISGTIGFFLRDELTDAALPGVQTYLITKDGEAAVFALDDDGRYLPVLADAAVLESNGAAAKGEGVFGQSYIVTLAGAHAASPNSPLVIGAQIPADLLRVMLVFFFEEYGDATLGQLSATVGALVPATGGGKVVEFAVLDDLDTATGLVSVSLAVYDRSHPGFTEFFADVYTARCYDQGDSFTLYQRDEPLADNAPSSYSFLLATPLNEPGPSETLTLRVTVTNVVGDAPVPGVKLTLAPIGAVGFTDLDGVHIFDELVLCEGQTVSLYYLRASRPQFYPVQFELTDLSTEVVNEFAISLSPVAAGAEDPTWVNIPAGSFGMGCSAGDTLCDADELPNHTVSIGAFQMTATEITQRQYYKLTADNPAWYNDCLECPVEFVTWQEAKDACAALGGRLPTEAEWEYAARAGTATKYHCGDDAACLNGVAWDIYNAGSRTRPAGQKGVNAFGLRDMHGNVWELTNDWYDDGYYASSPAADPTGPASGTYNVKRGGSWYSGFDNNRVSNRFAGDLEGRYANLGFRCVK